MIFETRHCVTKRRTGIRTFAPEPLTTLRQRLSHWGAHHWRMQKEIESEAAVAPNMRKSNDHWRTRRHTNCC